jgi:hypothetical protein
MIAANYNVIIDRAAFYRMVLTVRDEDGNVTNISPVNTAFYSDVRDVKTKKEITQFVITNVTNGADGKIYVSMPEANTKLLTATNDYEYDLFMVLLGKTYRLLEGKVIVRQNITNNV